MGAGLPLGVYHERKIGTDRAIGWILMFPDCAVGSMTQQDISMFFVL